VGVLRANNLTKVFGAVRGAVRAMAHAVPASYIFEDVRAVLAGAHPSGSRLAAAALLDLVYLGAAMAFLYRGLRHARVSGRLSRFYQ